MTIISLTNDCEGFYERKKTSIYYYLFELHDGIYVEHTYFIFK